MKTNFIGLGQLESINTYETKQLICKGCENNCVVTQFRFPNQNTFYSGNKCEKIFYNKGKTDQKGFDLFKLKYKLLFDRKNKLVDSPIQKIGIPKVLNMYENFPFWNTLFIELGFEVVQSAASTMKLYERGLGTVMSDSICFPAKLVHGHVFDLADKLVDRIFFPIVIYEKNEFEGAENSFNCPIVSSYADVIKSSINTQKKHNIPFDSPVITFNSPKHLTNALVEYFKDTFSIKKKPVVAAIEKALKEQVAFQQQIKTKASEIIQLAIEKNSPLIVLAGRPYHTDALINHKTPDILTELGVDVLTEDSIPVALGTNLEQLQIIPQWNYTNRIYNAAQWVSNQPENIQFVQFNSFGCGPDAIVIDECTEILKSKGKIHTLIRIDEITSTGSVRLRLRSLIESLKIRKADERDETERLSTAIFTEKDKKRSILGPYFANIYSDLLPGLFECAGYKLINLPKPDKESVQIGLRYSNNEICYPATLVVGDVIKALQSGKYDRNEIAVAITQTGGQCRASTYLSLIKKAMVAAGFADVPVISIGTAGKTINPQPGFDIDWKKMLPVTFMGILYADSLSKMFYSTVVREKHKGSTQAVLDKYVEMAHPYLAANKGKLLLGLLTQAVEEFNKIEIIENQTFPKIGVVGEIYVKYNSFGHHFVLNWLISQGIEVVIPPIVDFFVQELVNIKVNEKAHLTDKSFFSTLYLGYIELLANQKIAQYDKINSKFRFFEPFHNIRKAADRASKILNLVNQFGEGWLIPAEIASFAEGGVNNVISLQPFGCIANHVISKGVEKRIKDLYPEINLLFLDFDDGSSEVNLLNRLHFMVRNVKEFV